MQRQPYKTRLPLTPFFINLFIISSFTKQPDDVFMFEIINQVIRLYLYA